MIIFYIIVFVIIGWIIISAIQEEIFYNKKGKIMWFSKSWRRRVK